MSPLFFDNELLDLCHQKDILVQAWSPLARGKVDALEYIVELSKKYHKTPSQIALKWILQHQCSPIPRSLNISHMRNNFEVLDFTLNESDFNLINQKAQSGNRFRITKEMGLGFRDEFDFSKDECWPTL